MSSSIVILIDNSQFDFTEPIDSSPAPVVSKKRPRCSVILGSSARGDQEPAIPPVRSTRKLNNNNY